MPYFPRFAVFILTSGAIACSVYAALSCKFYSFHVDAQTKLPGDFQNVTQGSVGLFTYDVNGADTCTQYKKQFLNSSFNLMFIAAQFCAIAAPGLGLLAWLLFCLEWMCCKLYCNCVLAFLFMIGASCAQACTFLVYGQREFWYVRSSSI